MAGLICSVCSQLPGFGQVVLAQVVRECISAQVRLYNLGIVECRVGVSSFEVPGLLIRHDILSRGQADCCIVGPELPNLRASGPGV